MLAAVLLSSAGLLSTTSPGGLRSPPSTAKDKCAGLTRLAELCRPLGKHLLGAEGQGPAGGPLVAVSACSCLLPFLSRLPPFLSRRSPPLCWEHSVVPPLHGIKGLGSLTMTCRSDLLLLLRWLMKIKHVLSTLYTGM